MAAPPPRRPLPRSRVCRRRAGGCVPPAGPTAGATPRSAFSGGGASATKLPRGGEGELEKAQWLPGRPGSLLRGVLGARGRVCVRGVATLEHAERVREQLSRGGGRRQETSASGPQEWVGRVRRPYLPRWVWEAPIYGTSVLERVTFERWGGCRERPGRATAGWSGGERSLRLPGVAHLPRACSAEGPAEGPRELPRTVSHPECAPPASRRPPPPVHSRTAAARALRDRAGEAAAAPVAWREHCPFESPPRRVCKAGGGRSAAELAPGAPSQGCLPRAGARRLATAPFRGAAAGTTTTAESFFGASWRKNGAARRLLLLRCKVWIEGRGLNGAEKGGRLQPEPVAAPKAPRPCAAVRALLEGTGHPSLRQESRSEGEGGKGGSAGPGAGSAQIYWGRAAPPPRGSEPSDHTCSGRGALGSALRNPGRPKGGGEASCEWRGGCVAPGAPPGSPPAACNAFSGLDLERAGGDLP